MPVEPSIKRVLAFIDAQNLYRKAKTACGYHYPNYDVHALATAVCALRGWQLNQVRFYIGIPDATDNAFWNHFWTNKFAQMGPQGVHVYWRLLRYGNESVSLPDGSQTTVLVGREKGVDEQWSTRTLEKKIGGMLFERTALSRKPAELAAMELKQLREEDKLTPDL